MSLRDSAVEYLRNKASQLPTGPGVYLYKDAAATVLYVGKAKNLRSRVRSYFLEERLAEAKTGSLIQEAADLDYILLDNEKEALALENNLIKQYKPRFNILLRDDKTYPYIKLTAEQWPRVYVTRRVRKDGASYFGPYFPGNLAHRLVKFIHRHFKIPSCKVDLTRFHPQPCLEFHIHRCLGPCVEWPDHAGSLRRAGSERAPLSGRAPARLSDGLRQRMELASEEMRFEEAGALRDLLQTVLEMDEKQKMAAASGDDTDIYAYYAEPPQVSVNLFHLRNGRIVDRREFFWEDVTELDPRRVLHHAADADLLRGAAGPRHYPLARRIRGPRPAGGVALRKARAQGGDPHPAARPEEGPARAGGIERPQQFRTAFPRVEADLEGHFRGAGGGPRPARSAQPHRVLRHLPHLRAPTRWPAWWCGKRAG